MKRVYLMRHSTPLRLNVPTEDLPLSEEGRALALEKRAVFKNVGKCYSSPYKRAYETAGLIKDEYEIVEGLHERIIGEEEEGLWLKQYQDYDYKAREENLSIKLDLEWLLRLLKYWMPCKMGMKSSSYLMPPLSVPTS